MIIDVTVWLEIYYIICVFVLVYIKLPEKIKYLLIDNINKIKNQIDEAE